MNQTQTVICQRDSSLGTGDLELWRAAAGGNHAAFHELVDRHGPYLFRLALSLSGSRSDAEDICQEAFAAAFRGLKTFAGRSSVKTWLSSILMRRAAKTWKKGRNARRTLSLSRPIGASQESSRRENPGGVLAEQFSKESVNNVVDQRLDIMEAVRTLSPEFRDAIVLREIEGMSYQEIADILGVPRGTVESRLHRGRAALREKLTGY